MNNIKNYYKNLDVLESADITAIREAYKLLSQKYDPRSFHGSTKFASDMMSELNEAYEVLSDPEKKRQYDNLISTRNLSSLATPESRTKNSKLSSTQNLIDTTKLGAWRRFWARSLDGMIYQTFVVILLISIPSEWLTTEVRDNGVILYWIISIVVWCIAEAIILTTFETTLGKAILGIVLAKKNLDTPDFNDYIKRSFDVLLRGYALLIPLVGIVTFILCKRRLEEKGETVWDEKYQFKVTISSINVTRVMFYIITILVVATIHQAAFKSLENKIKDSIDTEYLQPTFNVPVLKSEIESTLPQPRADISIIDNINGHENNTNEIPSKIFMYGREWKFSRLDILKTRENKLGEKVPCDDDSCYAEKYIASDIQDDEYGNKIVTTLFKYSKVKDFRIDQGYEYAINCLTKFVTSVRSCSYNPTSESSICSEKDKDYQKKMFEDQLDFLVDERRFACNS